MTDRQPDRLVQAVWLTLFLGAAVTTGLLALRFVWPSILPF
jgi:hypothetical protein